MAEEIEFYRETEFKDSENGKIPKEWEVVKLKDVLLLLRNGITLRQIKEGKGYPVTRIETISEEKIDPSKLGYVVGLHEKDIEEYRLIEGDILFSHINSLEHIGKTAIYEGEPGFILHGMNLLLLRPDKNKVDTKFLLYLLRLFRTRRVFEIMAKKAVNQASINQTELGNLKIFLPPLLEQQRIVEILSNIDEAIRKTDDIIAKTERLKKGLMQELLTKGIGHKEFKDTENGKIPKEWEVRRLAEIGELSRGLSYGGQEKFAKEVSGGYLFFTLNSIKEGGGLKENGWSWIMTDRVKERHFVKKGDIVIANTEQSKDGSLIGSPAIVHFPEWYKKDKAVSSMDLSKLLLKVSNVDINFLFYYLSFIQPLARKYHTGTNVWHLNLDSWARDLLIPLPSLAEQQKISEILSNVDEKRETLKLEKIKLKRIKQWFMEELLSGRIRVKVT